MFQLCLSSDDPQKVFLSCQYQAFVSFYEIRNIKVSATDIWFLWYLVWVFGYKQLCEISDCFSLQKLT